MEPDDPISRLSDGFFLSAHCPGWIFRYSPCSYCDDIPDKRKKDASLD
jgi:hypothetical protein